MDSPVRLSHTQLVILTAASKREDRCLIAPKNLKRGAAEKIAAKLIEASLVREIKTKPSMPVWRHDEEAGQAFSLKLTAAGLRAIAIDEANSQPEESAAASPSEDASNITGGANSALAEVGATAEIAASATDSAAPIANSHPSAAAPRPGTKIARVIELLQGDQGATLESLIVATGWLPHTARAALTGLRHRGYDVHLERGEKGCASVYRIDASLATGS